MFFFKKVKHTPIVWPSHTTPRYLSETNEGICSHKGFVTSLSAIAKPGNNPNIHKQVSGWTKVGISTQWYYSALKKNKLSIHATTWIQFKTIRLSEWDQSKLCILYDAIYTKLENENQYIVIENRKWSWGEMGRKVRQDGGTVKGTWVNFWGWWIHSLTWSW